MGNEIKKIRVLVNKLNEASKAYYQEDREIMSNYDYDQLYDELVAIEEKTGVVLSESPTRKVGYEVLSELPKERHVGSMLSLDKTKEGATLVNFLKEKKALLSWKLDGLTIVLTYRDGQLYKAVTRGNGQIGEVVTNNARVFKNVPLSVPYKEELIIRGEAIIKFSDFNKINEALPLEAKYKNPRNLCSGSVRQLNNEITAQRKVNFFAFQVVKAEDVDFNDSKLNQIKWLETLGFEVVESMMVTKDTIESAIENFATKIATNDFGSDGLVLTYDSLNYSDQLGATSKFPKHSIAFKWKDEVKETILLEMEWSASRTGLINPVAIFEPVELEGTTVARASVHNISIVEELELGIGDTIEVYKANMIIPQIADNKSRSNTLEIPKQCPVCGGETKLKNVNDVKALYCVNKDCQAKKIKSFTHFVSRDAINIVGLSEVTLKKFIKKHFLKTIADIYRLERFEDEIVLMEGFGKKSYNNLMTAIQNSKIVRLPNFIYALGILNVGLSNAQLLCKYYQFDFNKILDATVDDLLKIEGYGDVIALSIVEYFNNEDHRSVIEDLLSYIAFEVIEINTSSMKLEGKNFVITGSLEGYENRKALKEYIESLGGKVTGSVTGKTDYLINNDVNSTSSKNKKAKELGVLIINEDGFKDLLE